MELIVLAFLVGIGPLALLLGVDSRELDDRGCWPAAERQRAPSGRRARTPRAAPDTAPTPALEGAGRGEELLTPA